MDHFIVFTSWSGGYDDRDLHLDMIGRVTQITCDYVLGLVLAGDARSHVAILSVTVNERGDGTIYRNVQQLNVLADAQSPVSMLHRGVRSVIDGLPLASLASPVLDVPDAVGAETMLPYVCAAIVTAAGKELEAAVVSQSRTQAARAATKAATVQRAGASVARAVAAMDVDVAEPYIVQPVLPARITIFNIGALPAPAPALVRDVAAAVQQGIAVHFVALQETAPPSADTIKDAFMRTLLRGMSATDARRVTASNASMPLLGISLLPLDDAALTHMYKTWEALHMSPEECLVALDDATPPLRLQGIPACTQGACRLPARLRAVHMTRMSDFSATHICSGGVLLSFPPVAAGQVVDAWSTLLAQLQADDAGLIMCSDLPAVAQREPPVHWFIALPQATYAHSDAPATDALCVFQLATRETVLLPRPIHAARVGQPPADVARRIRLPLDTMPYDPLHHSSSVLADVAADLPKALLDAVLHTGAARALHARAVTVKPTAKTPRRTSAATHNAPSTFAVHVNAATRHGVHTITAGNDDELTAFMTPAPAAAGAEAQLPVHRPRDESSDSPPPEAAPRKRLRALDTPTASVSLQSTAVATPGIAAAMGDAELDPDILRMLSADAPPMSESEWTAAMQRTAAAQAPVAATVTSANSSRAPAAAPAIVPTAAVLATAPTARPRVSLTTPFVLPTRVAAPTVSHRLLTGIVDATRTSAAGPRRFTPPVTAASAVPPIQPPSDHSAAGRP